MAVTQKQIAEKLGVSRQLVGFAMGESTAISDETRRQIRAEALSMGYMPNGLARAMKSGRLGCVALLLSTQEERSHLPPNLLDGIHDTLAAHDLHLVLTKLPDDKLTSEGFVPKILREWMADGLLIDYINHIPERMIELIHKYQVPAIWINSRQETDCARPDDEEAALRATRHLLSLGHRRIAYVDTHSLRGSETHYSVNDRRQGYRRAMREAGLAPRVLAGESRRGHETEAAIAALKGADRPTALLSYGAETAISAVLSTGLRVPEELSLLTFYPREWRLLNLPLSVMLIPERGVGEAAVQMLLQKIEAPQESLPSRVVPFDFEPGRTCAPPLVT